ncbi:unnamed protein product [marine sediment metagenome]|uniref:DUF4145 domain-containing protein n=1 Tax=marine sediment metagenome TaxID=412755 RepID=X0SIB2_9ZZZZ
MKYVAPQSGLKAFTCPHCGVLARQYHFYSGHEFTGWFDNDVSPGHTFVRYSKCEHCAKICLWHFKQMIYPNRGNAPVPNPDMPVEVKNDYEEAASIYTQSPRGAAALLRLAIQKLCVALGGKGKNINDDIKTLVTNGLPEKVQKSLDVVRVIGNNAVHPGQIDTDDPEVAGKLFVLMNIITEYMVSMPKRIDNMYSELPEAAIDAIEKRDGE